MFRIYIIEESALLQIPPAGVEILRQGEALTLQKTRLDIYLRNGIYANSPKSVYEERIPTKRSISIKKRPEGRSIGEKKGFTWSSSPELQEFSPFQQLHKTW